MTSIIFPFIVGAVSGGCVGVIYGAMLCAASRHDAGCEVDRLKRENAELRVMGHFFTLIKEPEPVILEHANET